MKDKSATHTKVIKNGHEGWIVREIWDEMRRKGDTNGFSEVANTPPEVIELKAKKAAEPEIEEEVVGAIEVKAKPGPKAKAK